MRLLSGCGGDVFLDCLEGVAAEGLASCIPVEGVFGEGAYAAAAAREDFLLGAEGEGEVGGGYIIEDIAVPGGEGGAEGDGGELRAVLEGVGLGSCQLGQADGDEFQAIPEGAGSHCIQ